MNTSLTPLNLTEARFIRALIEPELFYTAYSRNERQAMDGIGMTATYVPSHYQLWWSGVVESL